MIKKRRTFFLIGLVLTLLLSYVLALAVNNYGVIKNKEKSININNSKIKGENCLIEDDNITILSGESFILISFDKPIYVNKLLFDYKTENNYNWTLNYTGQDEYGNDTEINRSGHSNKNINVFSETINAKTTQLNITFSTVNELKINSIYINNSVDYWNNNYIFYIMLGLVILLITFFKKQLINHVEYLFLILALSFGIIVLTIHQIDIGKSWDDQIHYSNSYGLINDKYTESSIILSSYNYNVLNNDFSYFNTDEERSDFISYLKQANNTDTDIKTEVGFNYLMIGYLPESVAFGLGEIFNIPFNYTFTLAMMFNLLTYILVVFFAIKKTPVYKHLMLTIGLIPTMLFMASSFSYDPPVMAFIMLGLSYYLFEKNNSEKKLDSKNVLIMEISFVIASCIKAVYSPLILLLLTFSKSRFKNVKHERLFKLLVIFLTVLMVSTFALPLLINPISMGGDVRGGDANIARQLSVILHSPLSFAEIFYNNAFLSLFHNMFSVETFLNFAYLGMIFHQNIYYLLLVILLISVFIEKENVLSIKNKAFIVILIAIIYCMIWGALYLSFTPVGSVTINGVQTRYFIPILMPLLIVLNSNKIKISLSDNYKYWLFALSFIIILFSCLFDIFL